MKQVLITNFFFERYTGSELHALEMAKLFANKGYEVTIAVFRKGYPLLEKADKYKIVDVMTEELQTDDYDIIFVQHYPVFDYLCCKYNLSYDKLIVSRLSVINELEYMPICTPEADLILCVSEECAIKVQEEIGEDTRIKVFKNSVSEEFFVVSDANKSRKYLKRIAIISNHVPEELRQLSQMIGDEYEVDYVGVQYVPRLVDAELLKSYDLVITIGRTVQQCFALKVPVYVYDYFGGPGYINDGNFELAEKNNFSGRGFEKKTTAELITDILGNYENNLLKLQKLNGIAQKEYSYQSNFEKVYQELMSCNSAKKKMMHYYNDNAKKRIMTYSKATQAYAMPQQITSQMYIDYGEGFHEEDSIKWYANENYLITRTFEIDKSVSRLRFDPCNVPAECYIYSIFINGQTKGEYEKKQETFLDFDPQFMIELSDEERNADTLRVQVVYKINTINWERTLGLYRAEVDTQCKAILSCRERIDSLEYDIRVSEQQNEVYQNEIRMLQETIESIKEYYKMTPKNIWNRIKQFLKRKLRITQDS